MIDVVQFIALVLTALSMSVHFGTWLTERPLRRTRSGALFIEVHQGRDDVAARVMPILGNAAILFLALGTFFARTVPAAFLLAVVALVLVIGDMVVTLKGNVPINRTVQSWQADAPPPQWSELRDRWERLHTIRTALIVSGFAFFAASVVFFDVS